MLFTTIRPSSTIRICIALIFCALFFIRASAQPSPAREQKPPTGSIIRGRVVYSDTGHPLRRAEVLLMIRETQDWSGHAISDRNGEFVFSNVGAGEYFVLIKARDVVNPLEQIGRRDSLRLKIALGQIEDGFTEITVDGRSSVKTEIRASRGGVITGRVLSESDEPIPKATIKLFQMKNGKPTPIRATERIRDTNRWMYETDSRGIYRIAGLATGEYFVRASESDEGGNPDDAADGSYTDGTMMVAFHPKASRVQDAASVRVQQGTETSGVDIRFTDRVPHRISGTVVVRGKAANDAEIRLTREEPEIDTYFRSAPQARTGKDGRWEIRSVPDGIYTLTISGLYAGLFENGKEIAYMALTPLRRELTVSGADVTDLNFELFEGGTLNGVVSVEGGKPLPDRLQIELVSTRSNSRNTTPKRIAGEASKSPEEPETVEEAYVKQNGSFSMNQLPSGSFNFRVSDLGTGYYVKSIALNGKDLIREPVSIEQGKTLDGVRIVLSSGLVSLSGRAVEKGDRSKPLAGATVLLFAVEAERRRLTEEPIAARTDKAGRFVVKGAPGEYFVFVFDRRPKDVPIVMPTEASLIKNASSLQKVTLQREGEKTVVEVVGP